MFDVAWTDPVETVGQRKTRKDQKLSRSTELSRGSSVRSSKSGDTASTQPPPSLFSLFSGKGTLTRNGSHSRPSALRVENAKKSSKRASSYNATSDSSPQPLSGALSTIRRPVSKSFTECKQYNADTDMSSTSDASVFSQWTANSSSTECTTPEKSQHLQPLSRNSSVTQSSEATISPRDSVNGAEQIATAVRISSAGAVPIKVPDSPSRHSLTKSVSNFPVPGAFLANESAMAIPLGKMQTVTTDVPKRGELQSGYSSKRCKCPLADVRVMSMSKSYRRPKKAPPPSSQLPCLQNFIRKMEAASPKIILERLKEEWVEVADASVYRELELEKQLWMLAALKAANKRILGKHSGDRNPVPGKVLSLYENQASASFLSALNPNLQINHLSTSPLSPKQFPNVYPLAIPEHTSKLPFASNIFTSIHAFSVPALLSASSIPLLLQECHRTLNSATTLPCDSPAPSSFQAISATKAGTLHLTILDPSPLPQTLGPRLRAWLDTHLILNLERQFRCINPTRLFPIWLSDAGLRAEGSTIVCVRFLACVAVTARDHDGSSIIDEKGQSAVSGNVGDAFRSQLKSTVGRMLWKEMWGGYVEGERWWWDDESVVEECERMGTCWEYAIIEAVKED